MTRSRHEHSRRPPGRRRRHWIRRSAGAGWVGIGVSSRSGSGALPTSHLGVHAVVARPLDQEDEAVQGSVIGHSSARQTAWVLP